MESVVPNVQLVIPRALRSLLSSLPGRQRDELRLAGRNVRELLAELARQEPQVHVRICDERGDPRPHINIFVNDDHVRARAGLDTSLVSGDVVSIVPAVSGG